jgi:tRNA(fMet)-specific endonuclease VapC
VIALCSVVEAELHYGVERSAKPEENRKRLRPFLEQFLSYAFGRRSAQIFGEIRASLHAKGRPIGPYDLQIAAIALAHDLTVVTHNTDEFARVPGLKLEDWEA